MRKFPSMAIDSLIAQLEAIKLKHGNYVEMYTSSCGFYEPVVSVTYCHDNRGENYPCGVALITGAIPKELA